MKTYKAIALIREIRIIMEVTIVKDTLDYINPVLWHTYLDWYDSRMWMIDINRGGPIAKNEF